MLCALSPYGTYQDVASCQANEVCGNKWRCARKLPEGLEIDPISGQGVQPGNPISAPDGVFNTPEECKCWTCNVDHINEVALCEPTDGIQGPHTDDSTCNQACDFGYSCNEGTRVWEQGGELTSEHECKYVADGNGGKRLVTLQEIHDGIPAAPYNAFKSYSCSPDSAVPFKTPDGQLGVKASTADLCYYTCEEGVKKLATGPGNGTDPDILKCYDCMDGDTPSPISGLGGRVDPWDTCKYTCDEGSKTYDTGGKLYDQTFCYMCDGEESYTPISGLNGEYAGTEGGCQYWCDPAGSGDAKAVSRDKREAASKPQKSKVKCVKCSGSPGPDSSCGIVKSRADGQFLTVAECKNSEVKKCGWGYGCSEDECKLLKSAPRGQLKSTCEMDSDEKCGWLYGCYDKFACVDGETCAAVPSDKCEDGTHTCFDSVQDCVKNSPCMNGVCEESPLNGRWRAFRTLGPDNNSPVAMYNFNNSPWESFEFGEGETDNDGYTWYTSTSLHLFADPNKPIMSIGIKDVKTVTTRTIHLKARGWVHVKPGTIQWYTSLGDTDTFDDPYPEKIAEWDVSEPEYSQCHVFDHIDLSRMCGPDHNCISHTLKSVLYNVTLQREDACGVNGVNVSKNITDDPHKGFVTDKDCLCQANKGPGGAEDCTY